MNLTEQIRQWSSSLEELGLYYAKKFEETDHFPSAKYSDLMLEVAGFLRQLPDDVKRTNNKVMNDDLRDLMVALDISRHARPVSPHEVFQQECLRRVYRWREALERIALADNREGFLAAEALGGEL